MDQNHKETAQEAAAVFMKSAPREDLSMEKKILLAFSVSIILAVAIWQLGAGLRPAGNATALEQDYGYDVTRLKNATNIMLALQDYNFVNNDFPATLDDLKPVYLSNEANLIDPKTDAPYHYVRSSSIKFMLCIYVNKGGVVGVNIRECPVENLQLEQ